MKTFILADVFAVPGMVAAVDIGVVLDDAVNFLQWGRVATLLLAILGVVVVAEIVIARIRSRLI